MAFQPFEWTNQKKIAMFMDDDVSESWQEPRSGNFEGS